MRKDFAFGMDISSLPSLEKQGLKVFSNDQLLLTLKNNGVTHIRLRLWVHPYDEHHQPYGGGTNDLVTTIEFAKRIIKHNLKILLDFHYSDFWADPGKQFMPKAWQKLTQNGLETMIYQYTKETLELFQLENIPLDLVQIGNEITNGMLWPNGKLFEGSTPLLDGYQTLSRLLMKASQACREVTPQTKIIIHLDRGGDKNLYQTWFTNMHQYGLDYDIIGLSYYPYWHGTLDDLKNNILNIQKLFNKEVMIMETSYAYTDEVLSAPLVVTSANLNKNNYPRPYPFTPKGQATFMKDLLQIAFDLKIAGLFYWEPAWLHVKDDTWATKIGREYIKETHKIDGNEWANQALFTQDGKANPALKIFKQLKGEQDEK